MFPCKSVNKSFGYKYARKKETKKEQFVPLPKLPISAFDDDGQYPPVVVISQYSNHGFPALAT
jgi:hypothetical protein